MPGPKRRFLIWMHSPRYPSWSMPDGTLAAIREALGPGWEVPFLRVPLHAPGDGAPESPPELLEAIADAEVYCGFGMERDAFLAARRLRWFHSGTAGVGSSLFDEMRRGDVLFTNSAGIYAEPMAEHALAMILHFARGLDVAARSMRRREWAHPRLAGPGSPVRELGGRVLAVIGYGATGSAVGRRGSALGMRVVAIRRNPGETPSEVAALHGPDRLHAVLSEADYVVLSLPETPETRGLIGRRELEAMGEECVLINLSRGDIVDEAALAAVLSDGGLRGAGLDVFQREPLPSDSPLWGLENVLISPHTSGVSPRFWARQTELILDNVRRYLADRPLTNQVRKELGY